VFSRCVDIPAAFRRAKVFTDPPEILDLGEIPLCDGTLAQQLFNLVHFFPSLFNAQSSTAMARHHPIAPAINTLTNHGISTAPAMS
jgi:hypothetical protein